MGRLPTYTLHSLAGNGSVLADTYGAPGGERDLLARGVIGGGFVHPYKARGPLRLYQRTGLRWLVHRLGTPKLETPWDTLALFGPALVVGAVYFLYEMSRPREAIR